MAATVNRGRGRDVVVGPKLSYNRRKEQDQVKHTSVAGRRLGVCFFVCEEAVCGESGSVCGEGK